MTAKRGALGGHPVNRRGLAWYMASTSGRKPPGSPGAGTWPPAALHLGVGRAGTTLPGDPGRPGQLDPLADPAA